MGDFILQIILLIEPVYYVFFSICSPILVFAVLRYSFCKVVDVVFGVV